MLLHELYFASLGGYGRKISDAMANALVRDFGSVERWRREFTALAEGLAWRDPELIDDWMGELSKTDPVVAYCAYGFATGCQTVLALRNTGFNASYMTSGHYGWKAIGGKVRLFE